MNSKQLRYFIKTADKGSISAAAKALDIAQPAISQQISSLEHELSVQLFERDFRGVRLTSSGEKFHLRAKSIIHQMAMAKSEIIDTETNPSGRISIGMAQAACNVLAIPLTQAIQTHYPNVELIVHCGTTDFLNQWLNNGQIDLAVTYENAAAEVQEAAPGAEIGTIATATEPRRAIGDRSDYYQDRGSNYYIRSVSDAFQSPATISLMKKQQDIVC